MGVKEQCVVPDGWRVVGEGMGEGTQRDRRVARHWRGLSAIDCALLCGFVQQNLREVGELHTDVPVGMGPKTEVDGLSDRIQRMACSISPLRIDAVLLLNGRWHVCEVKPSAGYTALGQVLVYAFYARRHISRLIGAEAAVITDKVQGCVRPVFDACDVKVFEVGDGVLCDWTGEPPGL